MLYCVTKRLLDVIIGGILVVLAIPVVLLAAIAIRLETSGNPFFLQKRVGKHGKLFTIFKLRGMYSDARKRFPELYDYRRFVGLNFLFHHAYDPRITRVGHFIRRTSIDELPNFLNVVLGSMSLVGPRPEVPEVFELYGEYAEPYISVIPGVTCLSKVSGRDRLSKDDTVKIDLEYVQSRSLRLDLQILAKTFRNTVIRRDVFGRHAFDGAEWQGRSSGDEGD